ncbi:MAG: hypothetical protein HZB16_03830 [Armatimonadetes bacterium]|nr:hypothetical protein [Armatimonadota bacterium]
MGRGLLILTAVVTALARPSAAGYLTDVPAGHWEYDSLAILARAGLVSVQQPVARWVRLSRSDLAKLVAGAGRGLERALKGFEFTARWPDRGDDDSVDARYATANSDWVGERALRLAFGALPTRPRRISLSRDSNRLLTYEAVCTLTDARLAVNAEALEREARRLAVPELSRLADASSDELHRLGVDPRWVVVVVDEWRGYPRAKNPVWRNAPWWDEPSGRARSRALVRF